MITGNVYGEMYQDGTPAIRLEASSAGWSFVMVLERPSDDGSPEPTEGVAPSSVYLANAEDRASAPTPAESQAIPYLVYVPT